jgi:hypothetical protein
MTMFLFAYRAPAGYRPGSPDVVAAWRSFFCDLGEQLIEPGNPVFERRTIGAGSGSGSGSGSAATELGGYSLVNAADLDEAVALARGCPLLGVGGAVEVGVITPLEMERAARDVAEAQA